MAAQTHVALPKPGYYHHYEHDSDRDISDGAIEILGFAFDENDKLKIIYRRLYPVPMRLPNENYSLMSPHKFRSKVWQGKRKVNCYTAVTNPLHVKELDVYRKAMYSRAAHK